METAANRPSGSQTVRRPLKLHRASEDRRRQAAVRSPAWQGEDYRWKHVEIGGRSIQYWEESDKMRKMDDWMPMHGCRASPGQAVECYPVVPPARPHQWPPQRPHEHARQGSLEVHREARSLLIDKKALVFDWASLRLLEWVCLMQLRISTPQLCRELDQSTQKQ
jgi:hypothetical protein